MSASQHTLAVIDLGSNTTKLTVLGLPGFRRLHRSVRHTRISRGMGKGQATIAPECIARCVHAVEELVQESEAFNPDDYAVMATSALREAQNAGDFSKALLEKTGFEMQVLTGEEEATFVGMGAATDPILSDLDDGFSVFDLGGGSLECIDFSGRELVQVVSLPLGAVRMSEKYVLNSHDIISFQEIDEVFEQAQSLLLKSGFDFNKTGRPFVGTGGAFVVARAVLGAQKGRDAGRSDHLLSTKALGHMLTELCGLNLSQRCEYPGMVAERADIMPAALAVLLAVADITGGKEFLHSYHNLPYGVAAQWLAQR